MNHQPSVFFSVIIPNYNHAAFLKQRIESVLDQTYKNFEIIILDDCSTDESRDIIESYRSVKAISKIEFNAQNSGSTFKQWQKGISLAKGDYIWIAESDDFCTPVFLERIVSFMAGSKPCPGIVYTQTIDVNEKDEELLNRIDYTKEFEPNIWMSDFVMEGKEFIANYLKVKNVIPNASAVVFRKDLVKTEYFDHALLNMKMAGDWLFWIKLAQFTHIGFIAETLNYFRNHIAVSRNHSSKEKIYKRVLEEKHVRTYLRNTFNLDQEKEWNHVYHKWFKANNRLSVLKSGFYHPKSDDLSRLGFLRKFAHYLKTSK